MEFQNNLNRLQEMMNLINSNQDQPVDLYHLEKSDKGDNEINSLTEEPSDTFLMGDKVISTTPKRENDEFIKSSVYDLVPIPRESEVTSVYDDLECDMPVNTPLPTTDVREEVFDINSPLGKYVIDFLMENEDVDGLPRHLVKQLFSHLLKNLSLSKGMSDEPLGNDSKPRFYNVTFSNPLFDFNDDSTLWYDNPLFDEEFEDISSLDPPKTSSARILMIPTLLSRLSTVTPLSDSNKDECFTPSDDVELLLHYDSSTPMISVVSILEGFTDEPPLEENNDLFDLESKENEWKKILYDAPIDDLMTEDKVFDPGIHKKINSLTYVRLPFEDRHYFTFTYVI
ncbi:hypothetical protein Tco_0295335 [Tanacetum coccineum]